MKPLPALGRQGGEPRWWTEEKAKAVPQVRSRLFLGSLHLLLKPAGLYQTLTHGHLSFECTKELRSTTSVGRGRRSVPSPIPDRHRPSPHTSPSSDALVYARLANDEKALRRVIKKFHAYTSVSHTPNGSEGSHATADDARDAFLTELASFELSLQKNVLVCEAEARQVEEYERERSRIGASAFAWATGSLWEGAELRRKARSGRGREAARAD